MTSFPNKYKCIILSDIFENLDAKKDLYILLA